MTTEIKTASKVIAIVDRYATKTEKDTLKTIKEIAKTAELEGVTVRELSDSIKAGLQGRDSVLKPSMAQNVRVMSLLAEIDGCPEKLGALNTVATNVRKGYGAEEGAKLIASLKGKTLADIPNAPKDALNVFDAIATVAKAKADAKPSKARSGKEGEEGADMTAEDVNTIAQWVTKIGQEGKVTEDIREALITLAMAIEVALESN
jgi:hypothetical protein